MRTLSLVLFLGPLRKTRKTMKAKQRQLKMPSKGNPGKVSSKKVCDFIQRCVYSYDVHLLVNSDGCPLVCKLIPLTKECAESHNCIRPVAL